MSAPAATSKDESQGSGGRKSSSSAAAGRQLEQGLKCPRCDSPNTKFCYYNNYSLTQPRHFCKTCRRYWTKGGALRNVPIGGGCRKNKKLKSSSSSSRLSNDGGFSPSLEFNLGGGAAAAASFLPFPRLNDHPSPFNLEVTTPSSFDIGFNYSFNGGVIHGMSSSINVQSSLASSIESLSSINQDLHWKLQQQRLGMLFGGDSTITATSLKDNRGATISAINLENQNHHQKSPTQPILFQNLEISSKPAEICPVVVGNSRRDASTGWFFGSPYPSVTTPTTTSGGGGGNNNGNGNGSSSWSLQGWGDVQQQYGALP